ncbi:MAG: hypothetical protein E7461_00480 [Ruminococcaceae bacterium]|nr:hypothetical protein [Oscillospiraceae bacterium]
MEGLRTYILSVVASAVICSGLRALFGEKGSTASLLRTICGIYMAFVLVSPLRNVDFSIYSDYFTGFMEEAQTAVLDGENVALKELRERIKEETESYILDKAVSLGADVSVEVSLAGSTPPAPNKITIKGAVSPYVKKVLSRYIKEQLGIPEEAQIWIQSAA